MIFQRTQQLASLLTAALLLTQPTFALELPLSSEAVREAYFLGQRRDEKTARFLETYRQHLPAPKCGPHVAVVELFTPYAEAVELSRQGAGLGYSAQQAEQDYRRRRNSVRIGVHIVYPGAFGSVTPCPSGPQSGSGAQPVSAPAGFWKDYQVRVSQGGKTLESRNVRYEGTHISPSGKGAGSWTTGFIVWLEYDAEALSSSEATVETQTPDGQHVVAKFDLEKLR
jgi:hypothetical protein